MWELRQPCLKLFAWSLCCYGLKQRYAKKPLPIKKPWRVVSWNFELGSSLSKKCNGNHEHGPCAGRETKETQLYTSLIVSVILRRFLARAKCLQQARLKPALACIVRGNPRRRQAAVRESHTTSTVPTRSRAGPGPQVAAGCKSNPFSGFIYCCLFWVFLVLENIIKMTANATVVNTNEFFCVPVGKARQAAIFLGNLVKNAVEEGKRIPRRMEASSDLGTCKMWVEDIGVPVIYAYSAYYSAKCRGMMKGEGQSMRIALEFLSKIFGLLSADECMLGRREFCFATSKEPGTAEHHQVLHRRGRHAEIHWISGTSHQVWPKTMRSDPLKPHFTKILRSGLCTRSLSMMSRRGRHHRGGGGAQRNS